LPAAPQTSVRPVPFDDGDRFVVLRWWELDGGEWVAGRWPVLPRSALAELVELARALADRWRWDERDAVAFIVSGERPSWSPVSVRSFEPRVEPKSTTRIVLEVEPCVTPEELSAWWRQLRGEMLERRWRPMGEKHLALARFAAERDGIGTTWVEDQAEWNRRHPDWRYDDRRAFHRDVRAAVERLLYPPYRRVS
jgi:hypothetical protein